MTPQAVLVDTNVVSYLFGNKPQSEPYRLAVEGRRTIISFQTYAELMVWSDNWSKTRQAKLNRFITNRFGFLPHNETVTKDWVKAVISARKNGYPIATADAWIAATALSAGLLLLTADKNNFLGVDGLKLLAI